MSVSLAGTAIRNINSAGFSHPTLAIVNVVLHETLGYFWVDRTGGGVVTDVADDSTLPYTLRSTLTVSTFDTKFYLREDVAADASLIIAATTSNSVASQVIGARFASSLGGVVFPYYHAAAAANRGEPTDGVNDTVHTSNAVTTTVTTALIVCALQTGSAQGTLPTARVYVDGVDTAAATVTPAAGAGVRCFLVHYNAVTPGAYHFVVTLTTTSQSNMHVVALTDETAGPAITDVDGDDSITLEQQNIITNVANEDTETIEIRQSAFTYTLVGDAASADMLDLDSGGIAPHPGDASWAVVNGDLQEDSQAITIADEAGTDSVLIDSPSFDPDQAIQLIPPAESGDYIRWEVTSGTYDETDFVINADMTYEIVEGLLAELVAETATIRVQPWDHDDGTWGAWQGITAAALVPGSSTGGRYPGNQGMVGKMLARG
jgi:hypothetical protein